MIMKAFHGSTDPGLRVINPRDLSAPSFQFGGLFGGAMSAAQSHGNYIYEITSPTHLTDYELNYGIAGAYDAALEIAKGNPELADAIMNAECPGEPLEDSFEAWEAGLEVQYLRGLLAAKLGYTSIQMRDEHGSTTLFLPGCLIALITKMTKQDYLSRFKDLSEAVEYESQYLSIGDEFLPDCARQVRDGADPTSEYWQALCAEIDKQRC